MNAIELGSALLIAGGGGAGAVVGYATYGIGGSALGLCVGAVVGAASAGILIFLLAAAFKLAFGGSLFTPRKRPGLSGDSREPTGRGDE